MPEQRRGLHRADEQGRPRPLRRIGGDGPRRVRRHGLLGAQEDPAAQAPGHFLFNTLNNISSLAQIDGDGTQEAIMQQSDLLRYSMYETNKPKVPLDGEVEFMRNYVELAPVKKKDIHESFQEANESAEKLNERMTELASRFATMQKTGITTRLDAHSEKLINTALTQMKATPKDVEKVLNSKMEKAFKQMDEKISEIKMLCIAITLFLNGLLAMVIFLLK